MITFTQCLYSAVLRRRALIGVAVSKNSRILVLGACLSKWRRWTKPAVTHHTLDGYLDCKILATSRGTSKSLPVLSLRAATFVDDSFASRTASGGASSGSALIHPSIALLSMSQVRTDSSAWVLARKTLMSPHSALQQLELHACFVANPVVSCS